MSFFRYILLPTSKVRDTDQATADGQPASGESPLDPASRKSSPVQPPPAPPASTEAPLDALAPAKPPAQADQWVVIPENPIDLLYRRLDWIVNWQYEWRDKLESVRDAAKADDRTAESVRVALENAERTYQKCTPKNAIQEFSRSDVLGGKFEQLALNLSSLDANWPRFPEGSHLTAHEIDHHAFKANAALGSLYDARVLLAYFALRQRVREAHVGDAIVISEALELWNHGRSGTEERVDPELLTMWFARELPDPRDKKLKYEIDSVNGILYRGPAGWFTKGLFASAALWGSWIGFVLLVLTFIALNRAGVQPLPLGETGEWKGQWRPQLALLFGCVILGAGLHVASKTLASIRFSGELKIYRSAGSWVWLGLRWVAVLRLLIPVVFVTATLWVTNGIATSIQDISLAILAGYSADSLMQASLTRMQEHATQIDSPPKSTDETAPQTNGSAAPTPPPATA